MTEHEAHKAQTRRAMDHGIDHARAVCVILTIGCGSAWCLVKRGKLKANCQCPDTLSMAGVKLTALALRLDAERGP